MLIDIKVQNIVLRELVPLYLNNNTFVHVPKNFLEGIKNLIFTCPLRSYSLNVKNQQISVSDFLARNYWQVCRPDFPIK